MLCIRECRNFRQETHDLLTCPDCYRFEVDWKLLHTPSDIVQSREDITELVDKLIHGVRILKGIGLAAPQIGVLKRVVIGYIGNSLIVLINPCILWHGNTQVIDTEGCLSTEGYVVQVPRYLTLTVEYETWPLRKKVVKKLTGLDARVIQHEVDHLEGKLIKDFHESP